MGNGFAWTIPLIQLCFAILFHAVRRAGATREAGIWSGAYFLNALAYTVPMLEPLLPGRTVAITTDILFALSFFLFGEALVARYVMRDRPRLRVAVLAGALAAPLLAMVVADGMALEVLGCDLGCAAQITVALMLVGRWPAARIDRALLGLSWLVVVANVCRTAAAPVVEGATLPTFAGRGYTMLMYADGMVSGLVFGVLSLIAVAAELVGGYRRDAHVDPLTGLLNRRGLEAAADAKRGTRVDGLVACDLDHFKRVNDSFGHDVGDRVLVAFADLIRAVLPAGGVAARVGGEEFVLYLPGRTLAEAEATALRLGRSMAQHDWSAHGLDRRQSASFGLATRPTPAMTLDEAVRIADGHLYAAKRGGRDQVHGLIAA